MKKFFVAMAVFAMTAGFAANAANDDNNKACAKKGEKCERVECGEKGPKACPLAEFKDLNLTDAQKEQLTALKAENMGARQQAKAAAKQSKNEKKEAKARMGREARAQYLAKVKSILTPEQYVKYLESRQVERGPKVGPKGGPAMSRQGGKARVEGEKARRMKGRAPEAPMQRMRAAEDANK